MKRNGDRGSPCLIPLPSVNSFVGEPLTNRSRETIAALLRNPDYCISAYSSLEAMNGVRKSEIRFKQLSAQERCKFDELTLVNFNNIRKQTATNEESDESPNEYIVITIIVVAKGIHELPPIKSIVKLKEALQKLSSIPSSKIMAVEVLWTPQKENDILTERQVREDYPLLHPL
ncbi:FLUCTUATING-LIGHT-ACCLIMATION protein 1, chloroplastic-like [Rutidosis leptorrhynchoides]|uniref:FLUCTUATING-LIGHT-ACCLIMATION protein 1, chloroplastic-like n=1 Tax=Rutidosis leptorrhynchoides TaxID=125765 RepID=UPI003A9940BD